jgi:hypothetical protein
MLAFSVELCHDLWLAGKLLKLDRFTVDYPQAISRNPRVEPANVSALTLRTVASLQRGSHEKVKAIIGV